MYLCSRHVPAWITQELVSGEWLRAIFCEFGCEVAPLIETSDTRCGHDVLCVKRAKGRVFLLASASPDTAPAPIYIPT